MNGFFVLVSLQVTGFREIERVSAAATAPAPALTPSLPPALAAALSPAPTPAYEEEDPRIPDPPRYDFQPLFVW
jgi:hypothetical protein